MTDSLPQDIRWEVDQDVRALFVDLKMALGSVTRICIWSMSRLDVPNK